MQIVQSLLLSLIALAPLGALSAEEAIFSPPAAVSEATAPVEATLVSENKTITPGQPFWVGVELKMAEGWDTYWQNPGDVGMPTQINWQLPEGFEAGSIQWPYPEKMTTDNMVAFGYTDEVLLLTQITPPKDFKDSTALLKANVSWLACNQSCQPGSADLQLELPVSKEAAVKNDIYATRFDQVRSSLPGPSVATAKMKDGRIIVNLQGELEKTFESVLFIPEKGNVIDHSAPQDVKSVVVV